MKNFTTILGASNLKLENKVAGTKAKLFTYKEYANQTTKPTGVIFNVNLGVQIQLIFDTKTQTVYLWAVRKVKHSYKIKNKELFNKLVEYVKIYHNDMLNTCNSNPTEQALRGAVSELAGYSEIALTYHLERIK